MSNDAVPPGQRSSAVATGRPRVLVIARGATATEAIAHCRRLAAAIHVRTEPVA